MFFICFVINGRVVSDLITHTQQQNNNNNNNHQHFSLHHHLLLLFLAAAPANVFWEVLLSTCHINFDCRACVCVCARLRFSFVCFFLFLHLPAMRIGDGWNGEKKKKKKRSSLVCASSFFSFIFSFGSAILRLIVAHCAFVCLLCVCVGGASCVFLFFLARWRAIEKWIQQNLVGAVRSSSSSSLPRVASLSTLCCLLARPKCSARPLARPPQLKRNGTRRVHADVGSRKSGVEKKWLDSAHHSLMCVCVCLFFVIRYPTHTRHSVRLVDGSYVTSSPPTPKKEIDLFFFYFVAKFN